MPLRSEDFVSQVEVWEKLSGIARLFTRVITMSVPVNIEKLVNWAGQSSLLLYVQSAFDWATSQG